MFTIAPEMPGNMDCIRAMAGKCLIAMGHTAADCDQATAAIEAGVRHVTHLFNAQTPLKQRAPGVVGAALTDDRVSCELIADTFHVDRRPFPACGAHEGEMLVLISDCTRAGGLPDGEYSLGGQPIFVKGVECRLPNGTIAGSVLKLNQAVRNLLVNTTLTPWQAVNAASLNPARRLGLTAKGSLERARTRTSSSATTTSNILRTIIGGKTVHTAPAGVPS